LLDRGRYSGKLIGQGHIRQFFARSVRIHIHGLGHRLIREAEGWQCELLGFVVSLS